jgi:hypothetical protein
MGEVDHHGASSRRAHDLVPRLQRVGDGTPDRPRTVQRRLPDLPSLTGSPSYSRSLRSPVAPITTIFIASESSTSLPTGCPYAQARDMQQQ